MTRPSLPVSLLTLLFLVAPARAQERPGVIYVTGAVTVANENGLTGESDQIYVAAPGGTTRGWSAGGGVFVTDYFSVEVEVASTGVMAAREPSRYDMTFDEERHDRIIAVNARWHLFRTGIVDLEPVVGAAFARRYGRSQVEYDRWYLAPPRTEISDWEKHSVEVQAGVSGGADVRLGGRHFAVLPSFRVFFMASQKTDGSWYPGGAQSREILQAGVAVRVTF